VLYNSTSFGHRECLQTVTQGRTKREEMKEEKDICDEQNDALICSC
jgi:hypothetical protein